MNKPNTDNTQPPVTDCGTVKGRMQRLVRQELMLHIGEDGKFCGKKTMTLWDNNRSPSVILDLQGSGKQKRDDYFYSGGAAWTCTQTMSDDELQLFYHDEAQRLIQDGYDMDEVLDAYSLIRQFYTPNDRDLATEPAPTAPENHK